MTDKELLDQYKKRLKSDIPLAEADGIMSKKGIKLLKRWLELIDVCPCVAKIAIMFEKKRMEKEAAQ